MNEGVGSLCPVYLEKPKSDCPLEWFWVYIDDNKVWRGIGHSSFPGHEEEKVTSRYIVNYPAKLIKKLKRQGYE